VLAGKIGMEGYNNEYNAKTSAGVELYIRRSLAPLRSPASSSVSKTVGYCPGVVITLLE